MTITADTTTREVWPTATATRFGYTCDGCRLDGLVPHKNYYRETSGSNYVPGRRYAHQAHTPARCAARREANERLATTNRNAALRARFNRWAVLAYAAGDLDPEQVLEAMCAAEARWPR